MDIANIDFSQATPQDVCGLIDNTLSGDNQKISNATKILKAYTKHKLSIKTLSFILINSQNPAHRQMSTVLLKRNLVNLYESLEANEKADFRAMLLRQYVSQNILVIQRGIATLIGLLLPVVELDNWSELKNLLDEALRSAPQSVATFVLLNCLLYHFKPPKQLYLYLFNALKVPQLAEEAMKCVVSVAETQQVDDSLAIELIKLWEQANWPEEICLSCLEAICTLAERRVKLNEEIVSWICVHIIANTKLSTKFRVGGLDFLSAYAQFNGKTLSSKQGLLRKVIETICLVCSEPFNLDQEDEGEPVQQIALWLIETLSINLKSKKIYPVLLEASTALINSDDVNKNNTGYLILGGMAEGCSEKLKKNLQNPVMNVLIPKGLNHQAPEVRGAAINALSYFSEYLIPDIVSYHATIIPSMIKSFDDLSTKVAEKALIAVDVFFDNMEEEQIRGYLELVIPKFAEILLRENSTPMMRNVAMSAIGSAIEASKSSFEPYAQNVYQMCLQFLNLKASPENNAVRAQNISVLGKLSNIFCGKDYNNRENFYTQITFPVMEPIYKVLISDQDPEVRQACFQFFYLVANAVENVFENVFDQIIPQIFKAATTKEPEKKANDFSLDSDSEDDHFLHSTKAAEYDEKAAAIRALGELANACPAKFSPFFDQAYKVLEDHYQFFFESVRIEVSACYVNLVKGYVKSLNNGTIPQYQCGLPCVNRYPENLEKYFKNQLIPRLIFMMTEDDSSRGSSAAINALNDLIKAIGPVLVDQSVEKVTQAIIQLFESQIAQEEDDQEQEEEDEDTDAYIFEPVCADLIPTLCEVLQVGFLPSLNDIEPYMAKFLQQREDINDNIQMAGCLSQCFKYIPDFFNRHAKELFESLAGLTELNDSDLNRNIAYCFAEAMEKCSAAMQNYLNNALAILKGIYDNEGSDLACKENALAAICRAIMVYNPPMPYEAFVNGLIQAMPFKGDEEEELTALRCVMHLFQTNQGLILPYGNNLLNILQNDLTSPKKYKLEGAMLDTATNFYNTLQSMK